MIPRPQPTLQAILATVLATMSPAAETGSARAPLPSAEKIAQLPADGGKEFNRLVFELSPYLLQHARNPVDWYPWCEEAFARAAKENKPVFLSVGYTTCHWCHVMEHESFEDPEVAEVLNSHFISVKVDREERPDIDEVYMAVTQAITGHGGWPMTVIMTPDKKPFFAGTYFPKESVPGRNGILSILTSVAELWQQDQERVVGESERITDFLRSSNQSHHGELPGAGALEKAFDHFAETYDAKFAGFGGAPKFPVPPNISFLLRYYHRTGNPEALDMAEKTLAAMRLGGLYDQVGFGSHRYSTDRFWLLPHFEKMLYDQALLAVANIEAYQVTRNPFYEESARQILSYVLRDMTDAKGGFYSAEDADSEGEEGKFYLWTQEEVNRVLGAEEGKFFCEVFNILPEGNFIEETTNVQTGKNIPHLRKGLDYWARITLQDENTLRQRIGMARQKLFAHREKRIHPQKDDKILTDWNGLMIAAFAKAAQAFDSAEYRQAAVKAADFVLAELRDDQGHLLKRYRHGQAGLPAHLEDYAFLVWGLMELYEATFEIRFLHEAVALTGVMERLFWDEDGHGFFMTAANSEQLLVRSKKLYGGAIPSGNAVAALNLLRLYSITAKPRYLSRANQLMEAFGKSIAAAPHAFPQLLLAIDFLAGPSQEIVIAGDPDSTGVKQMLAAVRKPFLPNKVVLLRPPGEAPPIVRVAPYTKHQAGLGGKATAYVCENFACKLPVGEVGELVELLPDRPND